MEELLTQIERRYAFTLPQEFREFWKRGFCTITGRNLGPHYLLLMDMEWMPLEEIAGFEFQSYHRPGFVPFATSGSGDLWCWQPAFTDERGTRVLYCPHDCYDADVYAPDFMSAIYRHLVDQAATMHRDLDSVERSRQHLLAATSALQPFLTPERRESLSQICRLPVQSPLLPARVPTVRHFLLSSGEHSELLRHHLSYEDMDAPIRWMEPMT